VAILARGRQPEETRRGLPGDPDDVHRRYIETVIDGPTIGCCTFPTAIRRPARNSTTSSSGSSDSRPMRAIIYGPNKSVNRMGTSILARLLFPTIA
jgi:hypothetical protein